MTKSKPTEIKIAYIGGAFGDGLHNILEAATYGMPIIFGKGKDNYKFQEAIDLVDIGGAFEIEQTDEIREIVDRFLMDTEKLEEVSKISKDFVAAKTGATVKIMHHIEKYLV